MNRRRALLLALAAILLGLAGWYFFAHRSAAQINDSLARSTPTEEAPQRTSPAATLPPSSTEPRSTMADDLNSPATDIRGDLKLLGDIFDAYRTNLRLNPVGINAEITAALSGKNALRLALIPRDHPAIDAGGELRDRWGTPFFFHQLSGTKMEIRSAGPDRKLWTDDDVVFTP